MGSHAHCDLVYSRALGFDFGSPFFSCLVPAAMILFAVTAAAMGGKVFPLGIFAAAP